MGRTESSISLTPNQQAEQRRKNRAMGIELGEAFKDELYLYRHGFRPKDIKIIGKPSIPRMVLREKQGDVFDIWELRYTDANGVECVTRLTELGLSTGPDRFISFELHNSRTSIVFDRYGNKTIQELS